MVRVYFENVYLATPGMLSDTTFNMEYVEFMNGARGPSARGAAPLTSSTSIRPSPLARLFTV